MINSVIAGFLIALGGMMYLQVGGIWGAVLFSLGLLTILHFKFHLFTGKAGLLTTGEITPYDLTAIWFGNLFGTCGGACLIAFTKPGIKIAEGAAAIINTRIANDWIQNVILGIFCGLLMYIAVISYASKPWVTVMCVSAFILTGFNHCVADMFYLWAANGLVSMSDGLIAVLATTLGNVIGCNIIPICEKIRGRC